MAEPAPSAPPAPSPTPPSSGLQTRQTLLALIAAQGAVHTAMSGTRMAAPLEALREGHGALGAGALLALFALAPILIAVPTGRMADRHGYHRPMRIAAVLTVLSALVAATSTWLGGVAHFVVLTVAAVLCGAGANAAVITTQRSAGKLARDEVDRVRVFSWLGIAPALANAVGAVVAGVVIDTLGFGASYAVMATIAALALVLVARVPPEVVQRRPRDRTHTTWSLMKTPSFKRLLFVNWLISSSWDVHNFAVPVIGHERGFNASTIGFILATFTLAVVAVRFAIPMVAARLNEVTVLRTTMIGTGLIFAIYPLMPNAWTMAMCAAALGVLLGSVQPMVMSTIMRITPAGRHGEAFALRSMVVNASGAVMPLAYGAVGAFTGAAVLFWVAGAVVAAGQGVAKALGRGSST
jgi:MFS family permease